MAMSGVPITREARILPPSNYPVMYLGRLSDGRTDPLIQTDLYVQQEFRLSPRLRMSAGFTVTNVFDQSASTSVFPTETDTGSGIMLNEAAFYAGTLDFAQLMAAQQTPKDPRFLKTQAFQPPRSARLTLKFMF
jgi:outer membrane receptor protein involved in Fe transport